MSYYRSAQVTLTLEADEDGNLELADCRDEFGSTKDWDEKQGRWTPVGWAKEVWANIGTGMFSDCVLPCAKLVVKGHMWDDGPDWKGDYDAGFKIDEIIERKPMITRFSKLRQGERRE